jgi:hypothetical protein
MRVMTEEKGSRKDSAEELREAAQKLLERRGLATDPREKRGLAKRAFELVQQADELQRPD